MEELVRTNDLVTLSTVESLLGGVGIGCFIADSYMSALEGSIGLLPRRVLIDSDDAPRARRLLIDAGLGHELVAPRPGSPV